MSPTTRSVALIGAPTDIGAGHRGSSMGPEALRVARLGERLAKRGMHVVDRGNLTGPLNPWLPPTDGYRHLDAVVAWNTSVHEAVHAELSEGRLPIMLGGDHCLAIGSISAVARRQAVSPSYSSASLRPPSPIFCRRPGSFSIISI